MIRNWRRKADRRYELSCIRRPNTAYSHSCRVNARNTTAPFATTPCTSLAAFAATVLLLAATLLPNAAARAQSEPLVLTNFRYLDVYSRTMVSAAIMVIEDGNIVSIDDPDYSCIGCQSVDLSGGFIVPGLIDLHQHLGNGGFARQSTSNRLVLFHNNLYWGITTAFNPSLPTNVLSSLRSAISMNPEHYPRFLTAGRTIGPKDGWGDLKTATVGGLKAAINAQINAGAALIKLSYDDKAWLSGAPLPVFSQEALAAAIAYAHKRERRVFVHTTQVSMAKKAVQAGADGITTGLISGSIDAEFTSMMKSRRVVYMATLSAFAAIADNAASAKRQQAFDPKRVNKSDLYQSLGSPIMAQNWRDWWPYSSLVPGKLATLAANTKKLIKAGVTVGIGSDAGTPGVIFGSSMLDEIQRHVDIGIRPVDALVMATNTNARILYLNEIVGTIEAGKAADLVIMSTDPSKSIDAFKNITYTVRGGRLYDRRDF